MVFIPSMLFAKSIISSIFSWFSEQNTVLMPSSNIGYLFRSLEQMIGCHGFFKLPVYFSWRRGFMVEAGHREFNGNNTVRALLEICSVLVFYHFR